MELTMDAQELEGLLKKYGWTRADAADTIGIGKRTLDYYLSGRRIPEPVAFTARAKLPRRLPGTPSAGF